MNTKLTLPLSADTALSKKNLSPQVAATQPARRKSSFYGLVRAQREQALGGGDSRRKRLAHKHQ